MLRVLLYASGSPASRLALVAVREVAQVIGVIMPPSRGIRGGLLHRQAVASFRRNAGQFGIPLLPFGTEGAIASSADLICVASFPTILRREMLALPQLGAINVHPSLLPRHRGPDPLFWTYFDDDRESGVTVHWMGEGVDDGDIIGQRTVAVERGLPGMELYGRLGRTGVELLAGAILQIENRTGARVPQDESKATKDPSPSRRTWRIDYDAWSAERLWHFLRGVEHRDAFTLPDRHGRFHVIGPVRDFHLGDHGKPPGAVTSNQAFTRDGSVRWSPAPWRRRVRQLLRPNPS